MAKNIAKPAPQNLNKYYWWGFGGTLLIIAIIFISIGLFDNGGDEALPDLPEDEIPVSEENFVEDEKVILDENPLKESTKEETNVVETVSASPEFVGAWRVYSERLFYDEGGGGSTLSASSGTATTRKLIIDKNGGWEYGSSSGKWKIAIIENDDWNTWGISSYGPTRKIVLDGWNKGTASGPIEEESGNVNFFWVLYRVEPPTVSRPGIVHMKFGK